MDHRARVVHQLDVWTAKSWIDAGEAVLVDVREPHEFAVEHIPGAALVPLSRFEPGQVPGHVGKRLILSCRSGQRSYTAGTRMIAAGHGPVYNLEGGILHWKQAGFPTSHGVGAHAAAPGHAAPVGRRWWPFG